MKKVMSIISILMLIMMSGCSMSDGALTEVSGSESDSALTEAINSESEIEATEAINSESEIESTESTDSEAELFYFGHASMCIVTGDDSVIYIDPFADGDYSRAADLILVTHSHYDHSNIDMVENRNGGCEIITQKEALEGGEHRTFELPFVTVQAVEAGNNPNHDITECVGYVLTFSDGKSVYISGDTSATQQMGELSEMDIDYAFFCCDGIYNMDAAEAARCAETVAAKHNIPYHTAAADTGVLLDDDAAERFDAPNKLVIRPGESIKIE